MTLTVLGVDPGTRFTGYGVVRADGRSVCLVAAGTVSAARGGTYPERLREIHVALRRIIEKHQPDEVAVEEGFFHRNARSALETGGVRGVALLAAAEAELPVGEYGPGEVRQAVAGRGGATKEQVAFMVRAQLGTLPPELDGHASDALAVALCHLGRRDSPAARQGKR